jgi:hypothetical protein
MGCALDHGYFTLEITQQSQQCCKRVVIVRSLLSRSVFFEGTPSKPAATSRGRQAVNCMHVNLTASAPHTTNPHKWALQMSRRLMRRANCAPAHQLLAPNESPPVCRANTSMMWLSSLLRWPMWMVSSLRRKAGISCASSIQPVRQVSWAMHASRAPAR